MESPAFRPGECLIPERSESQKLPTVMMTMVVTNRSIGRSNRTHQNSKRDNRKQNATDLH